MLGKKNISSIKKLAKKAKVKVNNSSSSQYQECLLIKGGEGESPNESKRSSAATPTGAFAVYVGEERRRFVVPTSYLSHPLFKMLLEKAYDEFGFEQASCLALPCSVKAFQQAVDAVGCCSAQFDFGELEDEFH